MTDLDRKQVLAVLSRIERLAAVLERAAQTGDATEQDLADLDVLVAAGETLSARVPDRRRRHWISQQDIAEWVAERGRDGFSPMEFYEQFDLHRGTAHSYLKALRDSGAIEPIDPTLPSNSPDRRYRARHTPEGGTT